MNLIKSFLVFVFTCIVTTIVCGQQFGDKDFYLVDSIDVTSLSVADQNLLNAYLKKVHRAKSDTSRLRLITEIARETHNPHLGLKYNDYILKQINYVNDTTYIKYKISSYSHKALIYSRIGRYKMAADNYNEAVKYLRFLNSDELTSIIEEEKGKERKLIIIIVTCILAVAGLFFGVLFNRFKVIKNQQVLIQKQSFDVEQQRLELDEKNKIISNSLKDIEALNIIGKKITSTLSLADLTAVTFDSIKQLFSIDAYGVGRYNERKQSIDFSSFIQDGKKLPSISTPISNKDALSVKCFLSKEVLIINNSLTIEQTIEKRLDGQDTPILSILYLPLLNDDQVVGVISIQSYKENAFGDREITLLKNISSFVVVAMQNSNLHSDTEHEKDVVERKNKEITDSINYAQRIQEAILPSDKFMSQYFVDHLVYFKPRDIVSGDFYWSLYHEGNHFIAAIDCTGHGVPGALMSMIGYQLLNKVVIDQAIHTPSRILKALNRELKLFFETASEEINDGMDLALVKFNHFTGELEYSGANSPLVVCRKNNSLEEIRPTRTGIGGNKNKPKYENHTLQLELGDTFYLFTDGFQDQFGGAKGKKMKGKSLRELFVTINTLSLPDRLKAIDVAFSNWKDLRPQVDDVCIIGVGYFVATNVFELDLSFKEKAEIAQLINMLIAEDKNEVRNLLVSIDLDNENFSQWKENYLSANSDIEIQRLAKVVLEG